MISTVVAALLATGLGHLIGADKTPEELAWLFGGACFADTEEFRNRRTGI